ncbi:MAG: HRDC domain-containing protein, partial [Acidobacteria bacterium]|nr:HRDC domain-containing protein [Acidobacteriota bacterium]
SRRGRRRRGRGAAEARGPAEAGGAAGAGGGGKAAVRAATATAAAAGRPASADAVPAHLWAALRSWRTGEAKRRRVPAFHILSDRVLLAVAAARPRDEEGLLAISGIGPTIVRKYGDTLLRLVGGDAP